MIRPAQRAIGGFTLVETLIVVAILGLLVAIGVPMWINSINRTKQSQTLANIKQIAGAWEARAADYKAYNAAGAKPTFQMPATVMQPSSVEDLLAPTYIRKFPSLDGWRRPFDFATDSVNGGAASSYAIRSRGRDGKYDGNATKKKYVIGPTRKFDCDIIFSNGAFITYPEGAQKN